MQVIDNIYHLRGIQPSVAVNRISIVNREGQRNRFAHREIALLAGAVNQKAAPIFVLFSIVLNDEAARAAHHIQPDEFAPVVKFFALF